MATIAAGCCAASSATDWPGDTPTIAMMKSSGR